MTAKIYKFSAKDYLEVGPELFRIFSLWAADKYGDIYIGKQ